MSITFNNIGTLSTTGCKINCDTLTGNGITNFIDNATVVKSYTPFSGKKNTLTGGIKINTHLETSHITPMTIIATNGINIKADNIQLNSLQAITTNGDINIESTDMNFGVTKVQSDITPMLMKKKLVTSLTTGTIEQGITVNLVALNGEINVKSDNITGIAPKIISDKFLMESKNKIKLLALTLQHKTNTIKNGFSGFRHVKTNSIQSNESALVTVCKTDKTSLVASNDIKLVSPIFVSENKILLESKNGGIIIEPIILHNHTKTTIQSFGIIGIGNSKQMVKDIIHMTPVGDYIDLAKSKDTADISANFIKSLYNSKKLYNVYKKGSTKEHIIDKLKSMPKVQLEKTNMTEEFTDIIQPTLDAPEINIISKKNINVTGTNINYNTIDIKTEEDLNINSATTMHTIRSSTSSVSVGYKSGGANYGSNDYYRLDHHNSNLDGTNTNIHAKNVNFRGVNITTSNALITAEKLCIETMQSYMTSKTKSRGFSISENSVSVSSSDGNTQEIWSNKQSEFKCTNNLVMNISDEMNLLGSKITGKGTIRCPKINYKYITNTYDSEKVGVVLNYTNNDQSHDVTTDLDFRSESKRMIDLATIDSEINVVTDSDITGLNRNIYASRNETENKKRHYRVFIPIEIDKNNIVNEEKIREQKSEMEQTKIHTRDKTNKGNKVKVNNVQKIKKENNFSAVQIKSDKNSSEYQNVSNNNIDDNNFDDNNFNTTNTKNNLDLPKASGSITVTPSKIRTRMKYGNFIVDQRSIGYKTGNSENAVGVSDIYPASLYYSYREITNKKNDVSAGIYEDNSETIGTCVAVRTRIETVAPSSTSVTVEHHVNTLCVLGAGLGATAIVSTMGSAGTFVAVGAPALATQ